MQLHAFLTNLVTVETLMPCPNALWRLYLLLSAVLKPPSNSMYHLITGAYQQ